MQSVAEGSNSLANQRSSVDEVDDLVTYALNGDFAAFDKIVGLYKERLYSVIYNMTFNHEDAADLTQTPSLKLFALYLNLRKNLHSLLGCIV